MLHKLHGGLTLGGIVPRLLGDEVAHGDAADGLAGLALTLGGDVGDDVVLQRFAVVVHKVIHLPGAVDEEGGLAVAKELHGLSVGRGEGVDGEVALLIQILYVVEAGGPLLAHGVAGIGGDIQLLGQRAVVHNAELKPIVGHLEQGAGDGGVALVLDGLAVGQELIPGIVRAGNRHAAVGKHFGVDKHVLPEAGGGDRVILAVGGHSQHGVAHVGGVVGVFRPDGGHVHHLARLDDGLGVGAGEEEEHVGLGARLKIGEHLGLPLLVGGAGGVLHPVAGGVLIALHGVLIALAVAVVAAIGGDHIELHRGGGLGGVLRPGTGVLGGVAAAGVAGAAGQQAQKHDGCQKQCKQSVLFHSITSLILWSPAPYVLCILIIHLLGLQANSPDCHLLYILAGRQLDTIRRDSQRQKMTKDA